jgi:hypothetical protein
MPITISINSGADFEPVSEGVHQAVLADIVDLGPVQTAFGVKDKVQFVWLTDEADETGRTKYLFKRYTKSLHEKASLRKDVKAILGKDIDGASFDVETLLGRNNSLVVQHSEGNDGKVYANIIGIMKPTTKIAIPADFTRKKDKAPSSFGRPNNNAAILPPAGGGRAAAAAVLAPARAAATPISDDDIPF